PVQHGRRRGRAVRAAFLGQPAVESRSVAKVREAGTPRFWRIRRDHASAGRLELGFQRFGSIWPFEHEQLQSAADEPGAGQQIQSRRSGTWTSAGATLRPNNGEDKRAAPRARLRGRKGCRPWVV